jgi:hypothetical protein
VIVERNEPRGVPREGAGLQFSFRVFDLLRVEFAAMSVRKGRHSGLDPESGCRAALDTGLRRYDEVLTWAIIFLMTMY